MYRLFRLGAKTELHGTPDCIPGDADSSPSTESRNIVLDGNKLITLIMLTGKCNSEISHNRPGS